MKKSFFALCALVSLSALAQVTQTAECPPGATSCTSSNQSLGDVTTTTNNGDTRSSVSQLGNSTGSIASGVTIAPEIDNRTQSTQNADQNVTSNIAGGNTSSAATGGAATGNWSDNDNRSSVGNVSTGPSSASTGPVTSTNNNTTGPSSASVGNTTANGGTGGTGGRGGDGGNAIAAGGSATGGNAAGGAANQQQGIDRSGNSAVDNKVSNGSSSGGNTLSNGSASTSGATSGSRSNSGGNTLATRSSADNSGNSTNVIDAGNRSVNTYTSKTTVWAPVVHGPAAPALAAGPMVVTPGKCGPRVIISRRDIIGVRFGVWGGQTEVIQGQDEIYSPAAERFIEDGGVRWGHDVTVFTAVIATSSAGSLSVGGFGKNGEGAQGGGATSGALQQVVQRVTVRECAWSNQEVVVTVDAAPITYIAPAVVAPLPARADRN